MLPPLLPACQPVVLPAMNTSCLPVVRKACKWEAMIIVVANSKGGVGKSTLAVHLAAWLSEQGHRVILADCDTQHSSSVWIGEATSAVRTVQLSNPDQILDQ